MELNPRQQIIASIRGYFLTPVIANLSKQGFFKNLNRKFKVKDKYLNITVRYLLYLGLIKNEKNFFYFTKIGKKIFSRSGSFNIVHSYRDYLYNLDQILKHKKVNKIKCDRVENVIGSSSTNNRKFFTPALKLIEKTKFNEIYDIGCGDGSFLHLISKKFKNKQILGSDISNLSLLEAKKKFKKKKIKLKQFDASNVEKWGKWLLGQHDENQEDIIISMWFIIHEISENNITKIINLFKKINFLFRKAKILIGEIINPEFDILKKNKLNSILPEYLFFHQLSGQGVFNLKQLKIILKKIPYIVSGQINVDEIVNKNKKNPSGIILLLEPKKIKIEQIKKN